MTEQSERRFNEEDLIRESIAGDLPPDRQSATEWRSVFNVTALLGWGVLVLGGAAGLVVLFSPAHGIRWWGLLITLFAMLWGGSAVSVGQDGREVCQHAMDHSSEGAATS